jgi:RimJ/RimL family protein N-acetyltransferase
MAHAHDFAPVAAVFVDSRPVSFCYPVWTTERLWDVSIDTLEAHRGRALGARAVSFMIRAMRQEGREPVWGALESNEPSLRLGAKLGFKPIGDIVVFSRGGWVFLSGGFDGG